MEPNQNLTYQSSALYKFLHKHRERILKDRTKTPENTALFLLYLGFSLKDSAPDVKAFSELECLVEDTFITALDILCKDDADEISRILRDYSDQIGLTRSKKPKRFDDEDIYQMILLGKEIFPEKSLEKIYEKIENVTKISKSQIKKKYYSFIQLTEKQTKLTEYCARNKTRREILHYYTRVFDLEVSYLPTYKEFFLDMVSAIDEVITHSHDRDLDAPNIDTPSALQDLIDYRKHLDIKKKNTPKWLMKVNEARPKQDYYEFKYYRTELEKYYSSKVIDKLPSLSFSDNLEAEAVFFNFFEATKPIKSNR
ncbi:TPA: hypothetical protein KDY56_003811 [Vibrio parahaemolyticus]|uniref:hypothetical protein n=1 Tax=Vibrio parahaemolyticus TaxID=670 RepID=UPI0011202D27|nr:hypothetical protein [Vibrio parahaemolyticus]MBE4388277.1 hypothetical protein [Vibrio parahaemolyticus]TNY70898.1 hypothetical protein CGK63_17100 [Vibrio parahaemolyticus]TNY97520.1 hypothetical protein CGK57_16000 [Vibrio parahaemolyticus]HBC3464560.1 hypothetical protein [Vibrio parahaemolyticus]HBH7865284.1 hypothetical protein [Vibrio parahaemolyticus]